MKNKVLPFSLLVFIASVLLVSFTVISDDGEGKNRRNSSEDAAKYLASIRNNQHTGKIAPEDVLKAQQQINNHNVSYKAGNDINWLNLGPRNYSGRTRAAIYDNQDADFNTIIAAGVTGGIWRSTTGGQTWNKINGEENNLFVSCMTQDNNGVIYAGTGEYSHANDFSQFGEYGYNGGLMGTGLYKSTDGENFTLLPSTAPANNDAESGWAYINEIGIDENSGTIYAATYGGLKYSNDGGQTWMTPIFALDSTFFSYKATYTITCDSFEVDGDDVILYNPDTTSAVFDTTGFFNTRTTQQMEGQCSDVKVASDGSVIAFANGFSFLYQNGGEFVFENKAAYGENPYFIVKDSVDILSSITDMHGETYSYSKIEVTDFAPYKGGVNSLPVGEPTYVQAIEFAFAPSDPNVVYAGAVNSQGEQINIYVSEDKGDNWRIILPGDNTQVDIYQGYGLYANTISVSPNDPGKVLIGSNDIWEGEKFNGTGYYQWEQRSESFSTPFATSFVHSGQHTFFFHPDNHNQFLIGTNGGLYIGEVGQDGYVFMPMQIGYTTSQFYTVACSGIKKESMGGAQELGTIYISGEGNTSKDGVEVWQGPFGNPGFATGGYNEISLINPEVFIISRSPVAFGARFSRSEDRGASFSISNFLGSVQLSDNDFVVPTALWESFDNDFSRDSVYFYSRDLEIPTGTTVQVRSNNYGYPFYYETQEVMFPGDSVLVKDKVSAKYFLGVRNHVYVCLNILDFTVDPVWYDMANNQETAFTGLSSCLDYSSDANHLFVGTAEGRLFRMSNIALAYNAATANCTSDDCIIATSELPITDPTTGEPITQALTSVSVNPEDPNIVIVTLGNYGNDHYVFRTDNALDSLPEFRSIQGDLPQMPAYSSVIEMTNTDLVIVGTERGVYSSTNTYETSPTWTLENAGMGDAPVMMLRQQTIKKLADSVRVSDGVNVTWEHYLGTNNYGVIYAASYGRGLFRTDKYQQPVGIDENYNLTHFVPEIHIYPNPARNEAKVSFTLNNSSNAEINIIDLTGRIVSTQRFGLLAKGQHELSCNITDLQEGSYIIQLNTGAGSAATKFMVVK